MNLGIKIVFQKRIMKAYNVQEIILHMQKEIVQLDPSLIEEDIPIQIYHGILKGINNSVSDYSYKNTVKKPTLNRLKKNIAPQVHLLFCRIVSLHFFFTAFSFSHVLLRIFSATRDTELLKRLEFLK